MKRVLSVLLAAAVLLPIGCSSYATVRRVRPQPPPSLPAAGTDAGSLTAWLETSAAAAARLKISGDDAVALAEYNFATARIWTALHAAGLNPWLQRLSLPGGWTLRARQTIRHDADLSLLDVQPADEFQTGGDYVSQNSVRAGLGAPVAVTYRGDARKMDRFAQNSTVHYGTTAIAGFSGKDCTLTLYDPLASESVVFAGRKYPLAADFTTPLALGLASTDVKKKEIARLFRPEKYLSTARLARLQPYDPDKIPVIVIHGLMSSEATWVPMINTLRADPEIRRRYQFWFFSYPSGWPYPLSAAYLRRELDAIAAAHPGHKKAILIGHSMGGCISRLMITGTGDKLWRGMFGTVPAETPLSASSRKLLEETLIFRSRRDIARVIFIAAPLRGSDIARNRLGRLGSLLIKAPTALPGIGGEISRLLPRQPGELEIKDVPNSVDTLAPNNRFVRAINAIPVVAGIPCHVICGDRGKGGNKDHTDPVMSDGVVPYWSSHMENSESEKIIACGHSAQQNTETFAEVIRILKL